MAFLTALLTIINLWCIAGETKIKYFIDTGAESNYITPETAVELKRYKAGFIEESQTTSWSHVYLTSISNGRW